MTESEESGNVHTSPEEGHPAGESDRSDREVGGPTSGEAMAYVRALTGIDFRAFDCVELSPPYDPSGITAWLAANACFEMLSLLALRP